MNSSRSFLAISVMIVAGLIAACAGGPQEPYTTESGLTIQIMKSGRGQKVVKGHTIWVHYTIWLADGTQIKTTQTDRGGTGNPYRVDDIGDAQVISAWNEGIIGMRVGEIRKLTCPPDLAYGDQGFSDDIPPDTTIIYEIELVRVR